LFLFNLLINRKVLSDMDENEKEIYVLMQRFKPIIYENYIIRHSSLNKFNCTKISNELGIFGVLVRLVYGICLFFSLIC
jgi:hypothetical protein